MNTNFTHENKLEEAKLYLGRHYVFSRDYDPAAHRHHNTANKRSFVLDSWLQKRRQGARK